MNGDEEVNGRGWEMVAAGSATSAAAYDGDDFSVFPPSLHEGLTPALILDSPSLSSSPSASASIEGLEESKLEEEEVVVPHVSSTRISESARRLVDSGIELVRSKLAAIRGGGGGGCDGGSVWSFAAVAGFAGVLMYMRRRHRREKQLLLLMILEKDEMLHFGGGREEFFLFNTDNYSLVEAAAAAAAPSPSGRSRTRASKKVAAASATPVTVASNRKSKAGSAGIIKVRNEKLGERISALQQLVSPFGKTDTATVLHEAIGYIRFLHDQVQVLSSPYLQLPFSSPQPEEEGDLRSRGLCLVPVSCTEDVASSSSVNIGADLWSPAAVGGGSSSSSSGSKH